MPPARHLALALAVTTALLGVRFGTFVAGGADSYGYVSQADLWLQRTLIIDSPLARDAVWPEAVWALTPLGYRPGDQRGTMVPTYSAGLPMVMALFKAVGGPDAVYYVVPICGAFAVWLTFVFTRRIATDVAALLAALALALSPPFLFQLMWPMSDVPVTMWWLLSTVLALRGTTAGAAGAGLAAAAAILTRPNLVLLVIPIAAYIALGPNRESPREQGQTLRRLLAFLLMMLPGPIAVGAINQHLFGSALASGYGTFATIYAAEHSGANIANFATWMVQTSPFLLLAGAVPFLWRRSDASTRSILALALASSVVVLLCYIWYTPYDNWTYLRFLLPAFPLLTGCAAYGFEQLVPAQAPRRRTAAAALAVFVAGWGAWVGRTAFSAHTNEARYEAAGRFAAALPEETVILANQHSGSLRYYAHRVTLRFEWLYPEAYGEALEHMRHLNRPVVAVLDEAEREPFRQRYAAVADLGWLDREPLVTVPGGVSFYAVQ